MATGVVTALVSAGLSVLVENEYTATSTVLPMPSAQAGGLAGMVLGSGLLPDIGAGFGDNDLYLYPVIATSRAVLDSVLASPYAGRSISDNLRGRSSSDSESRGLIRRKLAKRLLSRIDQRAGFYELKFRDGDPELATLVVNRTIEQMNNFFKIRQQANIYEQEEAVQKRLVEVADSLSTSEDKLRGFREQNSRIAESPVLRLQEGRLGRNVEIYSAAYLELVVRKQRIDLQKVGNDSAFDVLDLAEVPEKKSWPPRIQWIASAVFVVEILLCVFLILLFGRKASGTDVNGGQTSSMPVD